MKTRILFVLMALMSLALIAPAQTTPVKKADPAKKKTMPVRDPKTGRFVKKTDAHKKAGPARDPKTGRFLKKSPPSKKPKG